MEKEMNIKKAVEHELRWDSGIEHPDINVSVEDNCVFLNGCVHSYPQKMEAERAALRVDGVRRVINNIDVKIDHVRSDEEIKRALTNLIHWNADVQEGMVHVEVSNGWVTLEGEVEHEYQFTKAEYLAEDFTGVKGVSNNVKILCLVSKNI